MRYIDTGSRDPDQALGTWLAETLHPATSIAAIRVQTGFFGSGALGYFEGALQSLEATNGHTLFLIGSNDGETTYVAIEDLLAVVGTQRSNLKVGVVSYQTGFFHAKVFHIQRGDGSAAAYVGSANLTPSGVRSQHVEAGIVLDTHEGDPHETLTAIASAADDWFLDMRAGLYPVQSEADVAALVTAGVLDVPPPPRPLRTLRPAASGTQKPQPPHSMRPLVAMPAVQRLSSRKPPAALVVAEAGPTASEEPPTPTSAPSSAKSVAHWSKKLSRSDAQRRAGHQSNLIALTQGDYRSRIDQTSFFREDLFGSEAWTSETTTSREPIEVTYAPIRTRIDGVDHGVLTFRITHAIHRESGTNSPTTELHLEPIAALFALSDMTGKTARIERYDDGSYSLTIS